jgi:short-subunit dehydrogenase
MTTYEDVEHMFEVNFFAAVTLALRVLPDMLARRSGSIINVTSVTAYLPDPREAAYGASKAALSLWAHSLSLDLQNSGIHVGVVSPGPIATETTLADPDYYSGRLYPATAVARDIVRMIEHGNVHRTSPRKFGLPAALYTVTGAPMRYMIGRQRGAASPGKS